MAVVTPEGAACTDLEGRAIEKEWRIGRHDPAAAAKGPHKHFMLKEIMEQPESLVSAMRDRVDFNEMRLNLPGFPFDPARVRAFDRVVLLAMGTSYHAAQVGRLMIEHLARLPAEAEHAGEFRYRDPVLTPNTLVVTITQSGETADSLIAMQEASRLGAAQIAVTNVAASGGRPPRRLRPSSSTPAPKSPSPRRRPSPARCSASTCLPCGWGSSAARSTPASSPSPSTPWRASPSRSAGRLPPPASTKWRAPTPTARTSCSWDAARSTPSLWRARSQLKEVSYIHAEGCQAGEMKHGPIALIDEEMPVLALAVREPSDGPGRPRNGRLHDKMLGNIEEVRARGGRVIVVAAEGDARTAEKADRAILVPEAPALLAPILAAAPLQLLAYRIAVRRGCDVDQPRNLAKTVTVE